VWEAITAGAAAVRVVGGIVPLDEDVLRCGSTRQCVKVDRVGGIILSGKNKYGLHESSFEHVCYGLFVGAEGIKAFCEKHELPPLEFDPEQASYRGLAYPIPATYTLQLYLHF